VRNFARRRSISRGAIR